MFLRGAPYINWKEFCNKKIEMEGVNVAVQINLGQLAT
jgi:hypothetical protein